MNNELKGSHILVGVALVVLVLPAVGWLFGWVLKLAFGGMKGSWAFVFSCFIWVIVALLCIINHAPVLFAFPFSIGMFLGVRRPDYV